MDRRQRKTRKAIFDAFEQLMNEEHYASVTVGQIIERADIGRSTFYAHFATKDDLLDQMCVEMFAHVFEGVETDPHTHAHTQDPTMEGMLAHLLCHLRDNHDGICGKLVAEGEPHFTAHFRTLLEEFFGDRLPERSSWVPQDLMLTLVVSGFCQAIGWWHERGYEAAPEDLAHWYVRSMGWQTKRHA
jgi:AcrR family transcriptional regulator